MSSMEMSEFLTDNEPEEENPEELDVQKVVVEQLAADKAEMEERLKKLLKEVQEFRTKIATLETQVSLKTAELDKTGDILTTNTEKPESNQISLLDRNLELSDRFIGETRDTVLEALKEARDQAEKDGRLRRAQLLEAVLVVNEPTGKLAEKRAALKKFFADHGNILSGPVIAELEKVGIKHKEGEKYLLASEIIKRMY